jgi:hypothetical protein
MLVVGGAADDASVARQHVQLDGGVVHEAVAERRRLDAHARDRAAGRDRLELRHHGRDVAVRERGVGERLVRHHAFRLDERSSRVDAQHLVEAGNVDARSTPRGAIAEQVRRALGQPDRHDTRASGLVHRGREPSQLRHVPRHAYRNDRLIG